MSQSSARAGELITIRIQDVHFEARSIPDLYRGVLKYLHEQRYLEKLTLPIASGSKRYILAREPKHQGGNPFLVDVEYNGYHMEAHNNRQQALAVLDRLLTMCGLAFKDLADDEDDATAAKEEAAENFNHEARANRQAGGPNYKAVFVGNRAIHQSSELSKDGAISTRVDNTDSDSDKIPTADEYVAAFRALDDLPNTCIEMLRVHYNAPNHTITARQLAQAIGWKDRTPDAVNLHYGTLAARLGSKLNWNPQLRSDVLATFHQADGDLEWILRPQIVKALERLRWV